MIRKLVCFHPMMSIDQVAKSCTRQGNYILGAMKHCKYWDHSFMFVLAMGMGWYLWDHMGGNP